MTPSPVPPGVLTPLRGGDPSASNDVEQHHFASNPVNQPYLNNQCRNSMSISNTKGLLNMPGQNNCFLNSAVQVLWHLDIFRRSFRELTGHACMAESCIFCALKELFAQFQYSRETALPPDALRRALAETFFDQRRFQLGFMDDAAECFENILLRIHCHIASQESEDMCSAGHCIPHQKFAMTLVEQTVCHACGATSEPLPFSQMVHYVSASALCTQARLAKQKGIQPSDAFGILMKTAGGMGDVRDCPSSCGAKIQIQKTLMNNPEILSVGLVWDSERPTLDHIMDVFDTIGLSIKLQDVFHSVVDKSWACATVHNLVGVVTYYGKHYSTFFFHSKLGVWIYFDDAAVREIGPHWEQVVEKCRRGHFQPLLLLYADPNGTPVSVGSAPRCITYITGQKKIPGPNPLTDHLKGRLSRSGTPSDLLCGGLTPTPHMTYLNADPITNQGSDSGSRSLDENCTCREDKRSYEECDIHGTYISRKAVEHVLNFQKVQRQRSLNGSFTSGHGSVGSRNSSSSLESFENNNTLQQQQQMLQQQQQLKINTAIDPNKIKTAQMTHPPLGMTVNLPRRRDSGNWSGDRNSASSASSTSLDNPYAFNVPGRRPLYGPGGQMMKNRLDPACLLMSDQGYDSFSLSSTDSYPSIGNSSPLRIDNRLGQILENVQLDLPKGSNNKNNSDSQNSSQSKQHLSCMEDCDKLCAEADTLLKKSNEKEHEGDLAMAALYSDAAAAKARQAMDAPYNNAQSMVSAKMKHSLCVMRSSNIHRRIKEAEADERRRQKEQQGALEIHHHRQSSRDSNHSRHSRQSSRDSGKLSGSLSKSTGSSHSRQGSVENFEKLGRGIELYATLPKKGAKKKSCSYEDVLSTNFNEEFCKPELKNSGSASPQTPVVSRTTTSKKNDISEFFYSKEPPETTGDYWTRQEPVPQISQPKSKSPLNRTLSGPANLKDASEQVKEPLTQSKKQHKIRRKLMGGLMRRKNRSLPDLREGQDQISDGGGKSSAYDDSELVLGLISPKSRERKMLNVANVTATSDYLSEDNSYVSRGFHQPHRAFVNRDFYQRPLLMKVNPPKVENISTEPELIPVPSIQVQHQPTPSVQLQPMPSVQVQQQPMQSVQVQHQPIQSVQVQHKLSRVTPTDFNYQQNKPEVIYQNQAVHNQLMRQKALEQQQRNASNERTLVYDSIMSPMVERRVMNKTKVEPIPPVRESSLYRNYEQDCNLAKRKTLETSAEELPVANSSFLAELQAKRSQILESSPSSNKSNVTNELSKGKWLEELQKKQQELLHQKQKDVVESVNQLTNIAPAPLTQVSHHLGPNQIQGFDIRDGAYASHQPSTYNNTQSVLPKPLLRSKDDNESKSVKDLASRFEHILYVKPQATQSQPEVVSNNKQNDLRELNTSRGPYEVKPVPKLNDRTNLVPGRLFTLTSTMAQQATHYPAPYSTSPSQSCHNESANEMRTSPSIPGLRDPSPMTHLTGHKLSPSPQDCDLRRPQRPPDYETAIQRLGLIRDIRSASPMENNNNALNLKPCHESQNAVQQEPLKKNRGTKKSVTFSDQVVLVACADDEESDYLPNPLLERVYKQHSMRTESDQIVPQTPIVNSSEDTVLCNLCHQQRVKVQNVYCPDCSFYVARFSPKK